MDAERLMPSIVLPALYTLLHLTALILGLVYYRHCSGACALVIAASLVNLTVTGARICMR